MQHRTDVARRRPGKRGFPFLDLLDVVQEKIPRRVKLFAAWWAQPRVVIALGAIAVLVSVIGVHYYAVFSAEIDSRLKRDAFDNSARIVAAPLKVKIGDQFTVQELSTYMDASGYTPTSSSQPSTQGSYSVRTGTIEVIPTDYAAATLGVAPVRIEIDSHRRVSGLTDLRERRPLSSVSLEGALLASMKDGDRRKSIEVQFSEIPVPLMNAIIATEDKRFFAHNGIDCRGIIRALVIDLRRGEIVQGGSTITQQLIKNAFLTSERSWVRKVKEAAMAFILESRLSKQEIFALYCSDVYLGQSGRYAIRGFAEAAQVYFDKRLNQLTLGESAFLAGLVHAPNRYAARRDAGQALARRKEVLDAMVRQGDISGEEAARAQAEPLQFVKGEGRDDRGLSFFIDYTERFVEERYGWRALASQTRLNTTLDLRLQQAAYDSVALHGERMDRLMARKGRKHSPPPPPVQAALVALDPHSGEILAMIGGRNYDESQLNRATDALRQPGSTFKPFVYANALSRRAYTAASILSDRPQSFSTDGGRAEYRPTDYGGGFGNRNVTLAEALSRSLNVPTVQLAEQMGISTIADFAETCGLPKPRVYLSSALGASEVALLDLAAGYTAFAGDGMARRPTPIAGICWPETEVSEAVSSKSMQALSPQAAFLMTDLLKEVLNGGTGSRARTLGFRAEAAGKTGTSRDGWFVGYTPNLLCAVWVGFDDNRDLGLKGSDSALPIWVDFMKRALEIRPELGGTFTQPGGLTTALIDPTTGLLASDKCPRSQRMLFLSGTEPMSMCTHDRLDEEMLDASEDPESPTDPTRDDEVSGEVTFDVCAETGLLPSPECRVLKKRIVTWRDLPIGTCSPDLHNKPPAPAKDNHP